MDTPLHPLLSQLVLTVLAIPTRLVIFVELEIVIRFVLRCVGGQFKGRLLFRNEDEKQRARKWGITDLDKIYDLKELAKGDCIFAATGVTDGSLLDGVKRLSGGRLTTESVVMRASTGTVRWVKGEHRNNQKPLVL